MSDKVYTYRDAGVHPRSMKLLNRAGELARRAGWAGPSLAPRSILEAARKQTGLSDLGKDTLREPLAILEEAFENEAGLTTLGRLAARGLLVGAVANRLKVLDWVRQYPEVREEKISAPWIILGLPRTGTTLLSLLMGLDPMARPLLQWEASSPVPPPDLATHAEDPRIAQGQKQHQRLRSLNPPIEAMHPFGATLATECVTLLMFDLRSLAIETQALIPSYGRWLEETDMTYAYELHELSLKILQSRYPTDRWVLKTPNHLWCLDTVRERYPDARLIWTHRDPASVVTSVASLNSAMHSATTAEIDPVAIAEEWTHKLHLAVSRGVEWDRYQQGADWCFHLNYDELMADPVAAVIELYRSFGEEPNALHIRRMEAWMRERPQNAFGRHGYDPQDFNLTRQGVHERFAEYIERFDVPVRP